MERVVVTDGPTCITLGVSNGNVCEVYVNNNHSQQLVDSFCDIKQIRIKKGQDLLEIEPVPLAEFMADLGLSSSAVVEGVSFGELCSWSTSAIDSACEGIDALCGQWRFLSTEQKGAAREAVARLREALARFDAFGGSE